MVVLIEALAVASPRAPIVSVPDTPPSARAMAVVAAHLGRMAAL